MFLLIFTHLGLQKYARIELTTWPLIYGKKCKKFMEKMLKIPTMAMP
jgi:hypothetical protein